LSTHDVVARLARACARGERQLAFVNELLADDAYVRQVPLPYWFAGRQATGIAYGHSRMGSDSWRSLKKRLIANGFIIKYHEWQKDNTRKIELKFSV
jgi:hypothetical protein